MAKIKLEKVDAHLREKLKERKFRELYELEHAKVALAQRIAEIRERNKLTQAELAARLHVSQQFISQIETAQTTNLTIDSLVKIAQSLGKGIKISFTNISQNQSPLTIG